MTINDGAAIATSFGIFLAAAQLYLTFRQAVAAFEDTRVSARTWRFWADGMRSNLERPAFSSNWAEISRRAPSDLAEFRRAVREGSRKDPRRWKAWWAFP